MIRLVPKDVVWAADPRFEALFAREMAREMEDRIRAQILAVNPAASPTKVAQSVRVKYAGGGVFQVEKIDPREAFAKARPVGEVRAIPTDARPVAGHRHRTDPFSRGIREAMDRLPRVLDRVREAIRGAAAGVRVSHVRRFLR